MALVACLACGSGRQIARAIWKCGSGEGVTAPLKAGRHQVPDCPRMCYRQLLFGLLKPCPQLIAVSLALPSDWVIQRGVGRDGPPGVSRTVPLPRAGSDLSPSAVVEMPVRRKRGSLSPPSASGSSGKRKRKIQLLSSRRGDQLALVRRCLATPFALLWR